MNTKSFLTTLGTTALLLTASPKILGQKANDTISTTQFSLKKNFISESKANKINYTIFDGMTQKQLVEDQNTWIKEYIMSPRFSDILLGQMILDDQFADTNILQKINIKDVDFFIDRISTIYGQTSIDYMQQKALFRPHGLSKDLIVTMPTLPSSSALIQQKSLLKYVLDADSTYAGLVNRLEYAKYDLGNVHLGNRYLLSFIINLILDDYYGKDDIDIQKHQQTCLKNTIIFLSHVNKYLSSIQSKMDDQYALNEFILDNYIFGSNDGDEIMGKTLTTVDNKHTYIIHDNYKKRIEDNIKKRVDNLSGTTHFIPVAERDTGLIGIYRTRCKTDADITTIYEKFSKQRILALILYQKLHKIKIIPGDICIKIGGDMFVGVHEYGHQISDSTQTTTGTTFINNSLDPYAPLIYTSTTNKDQQKPNERYAEGIIKLKYILHKLNIVDVFNERITKEHLETLYNIDSTQVSPVFLKELSSYKYTLQVLFRFNFERLVRSLNRIAKNETTSKTQNIG